MESSENRHDCYVKTAHQNILQDALGIAIRSIEELPEESIEDDQNYSQPSTESIHTPSLPPYSAMDMDSYIERFNDITRNMQIVSSTDRMKALSERDWQNCFKDYQTLFKAITTCAKYPVSKIALKLHLVHLTNHLEECQKDISYRIDRLCKENDSFNVELIVNTHLPKIIYGINDDDLSYILSLLEGIHLLLQNYTRISYLVEVTNMKNYAKQICNNQTDEKLVYDLLVQINTISDFLEQWKAVNDTVKAISFHLKNSIAFETVSE